MFDAILLLVEYDLDSHQFGNGYINSSILVLCNTMLLKRMK